MTSTTEKELDRAIEDPLKNNPNFTQYDWSRSNHPWGGAELNVINDVTGDSETVFREGETDVLVVFTTPTRKRVALHIENKLQSGSFTTLQPEVYRARAAKWKGDPHYGRYDDWETILVAPAAFYERYTPEAAKCDRFVSHEDIAAHVPLFALRA